MRDDDTTAGNYRTTRDIVVVTRTGETYRLVRDPCPGWLYEPPKPPAPTLNRAQRRAKKRGK